MYDPYRNRNRYRSGYFPPVDPFAEVIEAEIEAEVIEEVIFDNDQDFGPGGFDPF